MVRLISAGTLVALAFSCAGQVWGSYISTVTSTASDHLFAYWGLDSNGQASLFGGYTATWGSGVTTVAGVPLASEPGNQAAYFNGSTSGTISTSLSGQFGSGGGTMLAWVKLAQLPSTAGRTLYVMGESQLNNDLDVQFQTDNKIYFYTRAGLNVSYAPSSLAGAWHMIAATYTSSNFDLYWDGQLRASGTAAANLHSNAFAIGYSPVFGNRNFAGAIDEVALWNTPLTATQITAIYNSTTSPSNVPEPSPALLAAGGLVLLIGVKRRRRFPGSASLWRQAEQPVRAAIRILRA